VTELYVSRGNVGGILHQPSIEVFNEMKRYTQLATSPSGSKVKAKLLTAARTFDPFKSRTKYEVLRTTMSVLVDARGDAP
jgi:hypothetical protein